jgi:hypothetical protein
VGYHPLGRLVLCLGNGHLSGLHGHLDEAETCDPEEEDDEDAELTIRLGRHRTITTTKSRCTLRWYELSDPTGLSFGRLVLQCRGDRDVIV